MSYSMDTRKQHVCTSKCPADIVKYAEVRQIGLDWIMQCFTSPPTQYRLYGGRFLQVKRPNPQYQCTEGSYKEKQKQHREHNTHRNTK